MSSYKTDFFDIKTILVDKTEIGEHDWVVIPSVKTNFVRKAIPRILYVVSWFFEKATQACAS